MVVFTCERVSTQALSLLPFPPGTETLFRGTLDLEKWGGILL